MRIELQPRPAQALPRNVAAERMIDRTIGRDRAGDCKILVFAGLEGFRIEERPRRRSVGPGARCIVVVEPDADAVGVRVDRVLRERIVDGGGEGVERSSLQD